MPIIGNRIITKTNPELSVYAESTAFKVNRRTIKNNVFIIIFKYLTKILPAAYILGAVYIVITFPA